MNKLANPLQTAHSILIYPMIFFCYSKTSNHIDFITIKFYGT